MTRIEDRRSTDEDQHARSVSIAAAPRRDISPDELTIALEEGCGVLLVLEASRARIAAAGRGLYETEAHLTVAIDSLRQALALLREQMRGDATSALADGFVVRRPRPAVEPAQARPLRTA